MINFQMFKVKKKKKSAEELIEQEGLLEDRSGQ